MTSFFAVPLRVRILTLVTRAIMATLLVAAPAATAAQAGPPPPFDSVHAQTYFDEARRVSDDEAGRTWGKRLYGPIFFVDPDSGRMIANQPDPKGFPSA
jgi:hypothetical protein